MYLSVYISGENKQITMIPSISDEQKKITLGKE